MTTLHRKLSPVNLRYVESVRGGTLVDADSGSEVVARIGNRAVTRGVMRQLRMATPLRTEFINLVYDLYSKRDDRISLAHKDVNSEAHNYTPYKHSLFCTSAILSVLEGDVVVNTPNFDVFIRDNVTWNNIHRIYIFVPPPEGREDGWTLLIVDITNNKLYYIDPTHNITDLVPHSMSTAMQQFALQLKPLLRMIRGNAEVGDLECILYPYQFGSAIQNDFDSGIYVILSAYCVVYDCPLTFVETDMIKMRDTIAYWILSETLPM